MTYHPEQGLVSEVLILVDCGKDAEYEADQHQHEPAEEEKE